MTIFISYLIKLSISLAVVYLFYHLFLRRLTFYNWNRWYLVIYSFATFFIPFVNIYPVLERNNWNENEVIGLIPSMTYQFSAADLALANQSAPWGYQEWTVCLISIGVALMLIRLLIQQMSFLRIKRSSRLLIDDKVKVYQVDKDIIPFSFGNSIFVNQHQHDSEELKEIIRHEFIHVKQKHTLDILWSECLCILNWYNPFAWLIRKSIRQNLEFIADHKVLENGIDKKQYQYLLLKVVGVSQFNIATQFNFRSLKKRIAMMNKIRSAKFHLVKFLFLLPMMAALLLAFRNNISNNNGQPAFSGESVNLNDTTGNQPMVDAIVRIGADGTMKFGDLAQLEAKDIYGNQFLMLLNGKEVSTFTTVDKNSIVYFRTYLGKEARKKFGEKGSHGVHEMITTEAPASMIDTIPAKNKVRRDLSISISDNIAVVKHKEGKTERYDLDNPAEKKAFTEKYGDILTPPPPPPPVAPSTQPVAPAPATPPGVQVRPSPPTPPAPPAAPVPNSKGYVITVADNSGECVVIVKDRNSKIVKAEALTDWNKNESANVSKYGEIQPAVTVPGTSVGTTRPTRLALRATGTTVPEPGIDHGVIIAPSKDSYQPNKPGTVLKSSTGSVRITGALNTTEDVLFIIDGVKQEKGATNLKTLDPNTIESINVLKDASAESIYGEEGRNGVISITTKNYAVEKKQNVLSGGSNLLLGELNSKKYLTIVDGKEYTAEEFHALDLKGEQIESLTVWKGESAVQQFGEKGKNGVIEIKTKKPVTSAGKQAPFQAQIKSK